MSDHPCTCGHEAEKHPPEPFPPHHRGPCLRQMCACPHYTPTPRRGYDRAGELLEVGDEVEWFSGTRVTNRGGRLLGFDDGFVVVQFHGLRPWRLYSANLRKVTPPHDLQIARILTP